MVQVSVSVSLSLCLCLCLSLSDEPSHEGCNACTSSQTKAKARSTLQTAEEAQQHVFLQLGNQALASMCLLAQSTTLAPAEFSIAKQHVGCTVHWPPPSSPIHAATWCLHRPVFHKSRRPTTARRFHNVSFFCFSSDCSSSRFRRTFVLTCGMRPSRWDVPLQVSTAPCLFNEFLKRALDSTVRSVSGSSVLATKWVERMCRFRLLAHVPIIVLLQSSHRMWASIWRGTKP